MQTSFSPTTSNWIAAHSLLDRSDSIEQCLLSSSEASALKKAKSFLSVGPGKGDLDQRILFNVCLNVKEYYGIDRDEHFLRMTEDTIGKLKAIKGQYVTSSWEDYRGPPETVEVVLLAYVFTKLSQPFEILLKKSYDWVKPGGYIIIISSLAAICKLSELGGCSIPQNHDMMIESIKRSEWKYSEYKAKVKRHFPWSNESLLRGMVDGMIVNKLSDTEFGKFISEIKKLLPRCENDPDVGFIEEDIDIIIIEKE